MGVLLRRVGGYDPCMPHSSIHKISREHSLTFYCEDLPADEAALAAGRKPKRLLLGRRG